MSGGTKNFFLRNGFAIGVGVVLLIGAGALIKLISGHDGPPPRRSSDMVMVRPPPPAPTPPPPPPPPPQQQQTPPQETHQQMMEQSPVQPEEQKPAPAEPPAAALGTNIQGNGPADGFGLSGSGNGFFGGGSGGSGRGGGSRFGWYATQVVQSVTDALQQNPRTRVARFDVKVRIWADATGRVKRVRLEGSTGDPAVDRTIRDDVLTGFQLKEPPPDGMPMPIVMHLSARRTT